MLSKALHSRIYNTNILYCQFYYVPDLFHRPLLFIVLCVRVCVTYNIQSYKYTELMELFDIQGMSKR